MTPDPSVPRGPSVPSSILSTVSASPVPAADVAWSLTVPTEFGQGRTAEVIGRWFVLTAQERVEESSAERTSRVRILTGDLRTGRTGQAWTVDDAAAVPYMFLADGRPRALLNRRAESSGDTTITVVDPRSGEPVWSRELPHARGSEVPQRSQFHAAGTEAGLIIGQVLGPTAQHQQCAVCALDAESGRLVWTVPGTVSKAGTASSSIVVGDGMVATHLGEPEAGVLLLVDAREGRVLRRSESTWAVVYLQSPLVMTPDGVLALEASDPVAGTRRAVAVSRNGNTSWVATIRADAVASTADGTVVLPMPDGRYEARTLRSETALWEVPAPSPEEELFVFTAGAGDLLLGVTGDTAVVLDGTSGRPIAAGHFYAPLPRRWGEGTYLAWGDNSRLIAYRGDEPPVGMELGERGEVPVFVQG